MFKENFSLASTVEQCSLIKAKGSFKHFPPTLIHVGSDELLLSDSRSLKFGLDRDNVELEYKEWDNLWHVFQVESLIPESQESFKLVSKFLNTNI